MRKLLFPLGLIACAPASALSASSTPAAPSPNATAPSAPSYVGTPYALGPTAPASPYPAPASPAAIAARPLLPPLVGPLAWTSEAQSVVVEDIAALAGTYQGAVHGLVPDLDPSLDVNAYASCDSQGRPHVTGTQGLLYVIDAISQTKACDELYGTRTYDAYTSAVIPLLIQPGDANPALPPNILPPACLADVRRWSRAHEWFDEITSFTFGHELAHHYLGHTGCAFGTPAPVAQVFSQAAQLASLAGHVWAQPLENAADTSGIDNALDAGVARSRAGQYRWTDEGGLALLDFFKRMETSVPFGQQIFVGFEGNHPPAVQRLVVVQGAVNLWHFTHPG